MSTMKKAGGARTGGRTRQMSVKAELDATTAMLDKMGIVDEDDENEVDGFAPTAGSSNVHGCTVRLYAWLYVWLGPLGDKT